MVPLNEIKPIQMKFRTPSLNLSYVFDIPAVQCFFLIEGM